MKTSTRREALGTLTVAGAAAAAGCTPARGEAGPPPRRAPRATPATSALLEAERLAGMPWPTEDPFLFCVHHDDHYPAGNAELGPAASLAGRRIGHDFDGLDGWRMYHGEIVPGFPEHPHRGFETVTVVRRGLLDHSDSLGAAARYGGGDVQWLTAGRGIQHAEMFPLLRRDGDNPVELFQLWLNLPIAQKMADPHFTMLWRDRIPTHALRDDAGRAIEVTTVAGALAGTAPPAPPPSSYASRPDADLAIWTIRLAPGARWTLPEARSGTRRNVYFFSGSSLRVDGDEVAVGHRLGLRGDARASLENGPDAAELLLLQGRPIGEPVSAHGPFVMSTPAEIEQAYADFQRTRFGGWPWGRRDPVHPPEEGRFARRPDGRVERPA